MPTVIIAMVIVLAVRPVLSGPNSPIIAGCKTPWRHESYDDIGDYVAADLAVCNGLPNGHSFPCKGHFSTSVYYVCHGTSAVFDTLVAYDFLSQRRVGDLARYALRIFLCSIAIRLFLARSNSARTGPRHVLNAEVPSCSLRLAHVMSTQEEKTQNCAV